MNYFSRRNNHSVEFSGHQEASIALRKRLFAVLKKFVDYNGPNYGMHDPWNVEPDEFSHGVQKEFPEENPFSLIENGEYHEVFTVVEIFLDLTDAIEYSRRELARREIIQAFALSGSVYGINSKRIELKITEDLARKIEGAKDALAGNETAYERFFDAVGNLLGRKAKPDDVVKDIFIAFEDYLKNKTGAKDYVSALGQLEKTSTISPTQKALLEKIYAYRSDTYGVGHAGNSSQPDEIDALWFVETVTAQLIFLARKFKQPSLSTGSDAL